MRGVCGSWLIVGDGSPAVARGAVLLDATERVIAAGPLDALRAEHPGVAFQELPAVLTPGLINAHTHLELSALRGRVPGGRGFVPWVDTLVRARAQFQAEFDTEAIDEAISELLRAGVMGIGDVTNRLNTVPALAALPIAGCVFHEVYGMRRDVGDVTLGLAIEERKQFVGWPPQLRYALTPHTPYTLHPEVLQRIVQTAREAGARTSLHVAEHPAERAFLESGGGPFAAWLKDRDVSPVDWAAPGCGSIAYLTQLGVLSSDLIAVHLTDARLEELQQLAAAGAKAVLCPRSNLHIELKHPPLLDILNCGFKPGLGTDSLASNASLDPLAEARALAQRFPTVPGATLLAMATGWGADVLGLGKVLGRIAPGLYPGVLAFEHGAVSPADPERHVIQSELAARRIVSRPHYPSLPAEVFA